MKAGEKVYVKKKNDKTNFVVSRSNDINKLYHYGVLGMKWGKRKAVDSYGGSITKSGKYKASNGVVIGKSKNAGVAAARKLSTTVAGRALSAAGRGSMAKLTGRSKQSIKAQENKERAALKEYYKVGGDRMLSKHNKSVSKAYKKLEKQRVKDLQKQYGDLEDQMTYGKNADFKKNSQLEKEMSRIENMMKTPSSREASNKRRGNF